MHYIQHIVIQYGIYELSEDYNQAEKLFYKIEQFIETLMKDNPLEYSKELAYVKIQLATIEADKENYTKAIELYENAVTLLETEADGQLLRQMQRLLQQRNLFS